MRHSHLAPHDRPTNNSTNPEIAILKQMAALAEKRSALLQEEAKLWSQASLALSGFASNAALTASMRRATPDRKDDETKHILNVTEAAKFLRLSPTTLNGWRLTGGGPEFVRLGRRIYYRIDVLEKFLVQNSFPHTSAYERGK